MSYTTTALTPRGPRDGATASPAKPPASRRGWRYIGAVLACSIVLAALLLILANLASAKPAQKKTLPNLKPFLVEDIYPGATNSSPNHLVDFKGMLVFAADHPAFGEELWSSKGNASNTRLVKDIDPGPLVSNPMELTETGSSAPDKQSLAKKWIYFVPKTVKYGEEAWKTKGTASSTRLVKDIVPGPDSSGAEDFVPTTDPKTTFFRAWDAHHGEELWKTDGTEKSTKLVEDINRDAKPGARCQQGDCGIPMGWSHPDTPTALGKIIFFAADDGIHGVELWKSDGTKRGTTLVKDINTRPGNSNPNDTTGAVNRSAEVEKLFVVGKTLYFRANDGIHGVELWKSDGTKRGTTLVKDINTDAPAPTTTACKRAKNCAGGSWADDMTLVGKTLYLTANDGEHGVELWKSDGTKRGTTLVKDINPSSASRDSDISNLIAIGKTLFLAANDGTNGLELWKSNGTERGTRLVKDVNPGPADSNPDTLTAFGGVLLFSSDDGVHGNEMWGSDGSKANTALLKDLQPGAVGSEPGEFSTSGRFLYFAASSPSDGEELWAAPTRGSSKSR
jgi:ELWxxDGT repeat protein